MKSNTVKKETLIVILISIIFASSWIFDNLVVILGISAIIITVIHIIFINNQMSILKKALYLLLLPIIFMTLLILMYYWGKDENVYNVLINVDDENQTIKINCPEQDRNINKIMNITIKVIAFVIVLISYYHIYNYTVSVL